MSPSSASSPPFALAAFDLDGTLLDGPSAISPDNAGALRALDALGVIVAPVTARFHPISLEPFRAAGLTVPSVSAGGADVRDADGSAVARRCIEPAAARALADLCDRAGWRVTWSTGRMNYLRTDVLPGWAANPPPYLTPVTRLTDVPPDDLLTALIAVEEGGDYVEQLAPLGATLNVSMALAHDGRRLLTVTAAGVDKGSGLEDLCRALDLAPSDAIVFGDSEVDLPMFEIGGKAVAMSSATQAVRAKADLIAPAGPAAVASVVREVFGLGADR